MAEIQELLINSSLITHDSVGGESFEFVVNADLRVTECVKVVSTMSGAVEPIIQAGISLEGMLFELNHIRVNPRVDNSIIIDALTEALQNIDVRVDNRPSTESMAVCYKPLGEISDNVRFYLGNNSKIVFLSPAHRPKLISNNQFLR